MNGVERVRLGDLAPAVSNPIPGQSQTVWNLSLEDVESRTGRVLTRNYIKVAGLGSTKIAFDARHVLYSKLRPYLSKVVLPDGSGVATSELIPMLPDYNRVEREYLAWYLRSPEFTDFANANTRGANLPRIAMTELWQHEIPLPAVEEQRRIVARIKECMARVDEIEALQTDIVRAAQSIPSASRHDLWEICSSRFNMAPLEEAVLDARNGLYKPRKYHGSGVVLLRMFNIEAGVFNLKRVERIMTTPKETVDYRVDNGDIVVSRVNSRDLVGKSALVRGLSEPAVNEAMVIRLRINREKAVGIFLEWLMNSPQFLHRLRGRAKHAIGQSSINQRDLLSSMLPIPPLEIQQQMITGKLHVVSFSGQLVESILDRNQDIHALRESILRKAFAGEL